MHGMTGPDGAGSHLDFEPPTGDDVDQAATNTAAAASDPQVTHSEAKDPLPAAMALGAGDGVAKVWVKSWNNGPAPHTLVTVSIKADGAEIAAGSLEQDVMLGAIVEYTIPLTMAVQELPAGAVISMDVTLEDSVCSCYNPFAYPRGTSSDHPWQFTLPLVLGTLAGRVAEMILENLTGPQVVIV